MRKQKYGPIPSGVDRLALLLCLLIHQCLHYTGANGILPPLIQGDLTRTFDLLNVHGLTWVESENVCSVGSPKRHMAALKDNDVMTHVTTFLSGRISSGVWIGGKQLQDQWMWITGMLPLDFPQAPESGEHCAAVSDRGYLRALPCQQTVRRYLCYVPLDECSRTSDEDCTPIFHNTSSCVLACRDNHVIDVTWYGARNSCLRRNGDLLSLGERALRDAVAVAIDTMLSGSGQMLWVGLRQKPWGWILPGEHETLSEIQYSYWAPGQPDTWGERAACLALSQGSWTSLPCDTTLQYVLCQESFEEKHIENENTSINIISSTSSPNTITPAHESTNAMVIIAATLGSVVGVFIVIVIILLACLRHAYLHRPQTQARKSYFDYFDVGFFRRMMPRNRADDRPGTVMLTDTIIQDSGKSQDPGETQHQTNLQDFADVQTTGKPHDQGQPGNPEESLDSEQTQIYDAVIMDTMPHK